MYILGKRATRCVCVCSMPKLHFVYKQWTVVDLSHIHEMARVRGTRFQPIWQTGESKNNVDIITAELAKGKTSEMR